MQHEGRFVATADGARVQSLGTHVLKLPFFSVSF